MTSQYHGPDRRSTQRNDELVQAVIVAVRAEVASQIMPEDIHREHHELIAEMIADMKRKRERSEKVKAQLAGWAIITVLSGIGTGVYQLAVWMKEHIK